MQQPNVSSTRGRAVKPTDDQLEVIARELFASVGSARLWEDVDRETARPYYVAGRRIWSLIAPMVLEEAAKVCVEMGDYLEGAGSDACDHLRLAAARIRALKGEP
jgi:hypothetical protein